MSNTDKEASLEAFYEEYKSYTDTRKKTFSGLCNKLLKDNFIYGGIESDRSDYYALLNYRKAMEGYLSLIDYNLIHDDTNKVFFIETTADRNRIHLRKIDTVVLLVLRLLYYRGQHQVSASLASSDVSVKTSELVDNIANTGIFANDAYKTDLMSSLKLLKRYKIITFSFQKFDDESIIIIYPTILQAVRSDSVDVISDRLKTYLAEKGGSALDINED